MALHEPNPQDRVATPRVSVADGLHIGRIPMRVGDRWVLTGRYVEVVWSEIMGPTATLLAQRLGDFVDLNPGGGELSTTAIGRSLGVPPSKTRQALSRMDSHELVSIRPDARRLARLGWCLPWVAVD